MLIRATCQWHLTKVLGCLGRDVFICRGIRPCSLCSQPSVRFQRTRADGPRNATSIPVRILLHSTACLEVLRTPSQPGGEGGIRLSVRCTLSDLNSNRIQAKGRQTATGSLSSHPSLHQQLQPAKAGRISWRRGRDSNPRDPCGPAGFQDQCLQPLGHLSVVLA